MVTASPVQSAEFDAPLLAVEDLEGRDLPEWWELVEGRVIELSPTGAWSGFVSVRFYQYLFEAASTSGRGHAFPADIGFILFADRRTMRSPDAAFVLRERLPGVGPDLRLFVPIPPDIAVEVLSPSDRLGDALAKVAMYLQAGVRLVWLADPHRRTVTVFTPDAPPVTLGTEAILDGGDVLPDLRVPVADIFAP
jgi:Uma2 family endonuclease